MKIDTTLIKGFDQMSDSDKLSAILGYEFDDPKPDTSVIEKLKASLTKATSEAAENKRKLNEKMTEAEKEAADRAERDAAIAEELASLRLDKDMRRFKELGVREESAAVMAKAIANLDQKTKDAYFDAYAKENEAMRKDISAQRIKGTKGVEGGGSADKQMSREDIFKITDTIARQNAIRDNMELFQK